MSKKLILYVFYSASNNGGTIGSCYIDVGLYYWLFPIFAHNDILKKFEADGLKAVNLISVLRSYR